MIVYALVLVLKILSVMGFAGGTIAAFLVTDEGTRKRAAHHVASPSLLAIWLLGYALLMLRGGSLLELWIIASLALSFIANGVLGHCVARDRRGLFAFLGVATPIVGTVVLMVLKPTWAQVTQ